MCLMWVEVRWDWHTKTGGRGEAGREEEEEGGCRKARRVDRRGPRAVENKFGTFSFF